MKRERNRVGLKAASLAGATILSLSLVACSSDDAEETMSSASETMTSMSESATSETATSEEAANDEAPFGPGCQAYAEAHPDGPASLDELKKQNIAEAVANIPELKTLTAALTGGLNPEVDLTDTLRDGEWTVFAPTEEAFGKLDAATVEKLKQDPELLKSILTYHVVDGQAAPSKAVGTHTTVNGAELTVTKEGEDVRVNEAGVLCGGIQLENAVVYMVDSVLMPPMDK
ncbi:fasciclin domain-containing protein [uncultured Corynebacterium sp.]|uniref:fasciclin domain-containing protein n=1 Tax=uncultured Corynebacterium sp. TaxID=159447 RepID=UPI002594C3DD|nr:fasciclin domain-containing protein [uncultured Corynebacterium sp.]